MKKIVLLIAVALTDAAHLHAADAPSPQEKQAMALVKEIQAQQLKLAENQAAIEAKLATVAEAVRVARIYASRGGR